MFCPQCRAEYRPGFHRCADCDVELVGALPKDPRADSPPTNDRGFDGFQQIWIGTDESTCVEYCRYLRQESMPYRVTQGFQSRSQGMTAKFRYALGVASEDAPRAKEILGLPEKVVERDEDAPVEEPVEDEDQALKALPEGEYVPEDERLRASYLKHWYPEDATVELSTRPSSAGSDQVDMALRENYIRFRVEVLDDGSKKYFVMPQDEFAAREIIREIADGAPPE